MGEYLFTIAVLMFISPGEARVVDGGAYIVPSAKECKKAVEIVKKKYPKALISYVCDPIKASDGVQKQQGSRA
jgi:hypothetical protein